MIVKSLILTNFGKHDRIEFKCDGAVVGLLGPNGAGKSTVLDALEMAITGEAQDTIQSYVRYNHSNATVEMNFQKNGQEGTIFRQFGKTPKRKLLWEGKPITAAREVDKMMEEIFGADKKAVANAVFINQGMLQKILFQGETDRKLMFIKLVNMSFCDQRRAVIDSRIKKLAATISDLGPLIDEKRRQMEEALDGYEKLKIAYDAQPDYTTDIQFCDSYLKAEDRIKQIMAELGRVENEQASHQRRMTELLTDWHLANYEEASRFMATKEEELKNVVSDHQAFTSIRMELGHYRSVLNDIQTFSSQLEGIMERQRTMNPDNMTIELIDQMIGKYETAIQLNDLLETLKSTMVHNQEAIKQEQAGLMALVRPTVTEEWIRAEQQRLAGIKSLLVSMRKFKEMREESRKFVQPRAPGTLIPYAELSTEPLKCHRCGLSLANPTELSEQGLADLNAEIGKLEVESGSLATSLIGYEHQWTQYKNARDRHTAQINSLTTSIGLARKRIEETVPEFAKDVAEQEHKRLIELRIHLPEMVQNSQTLSRMIQDKVRDKDRYPLAVQHQHDQEKYSQEQENALHAKQTHLEVATKNYRKQFEELTRLTGLLQSLASRWQTLMDEKQGLQMQLEQPMPPSVGSLSADLSGNLTAVKNELTVRQQARAGLYGRYEQAKLNHDGLQLEYKQLQLRATAEEAKQKLVEDLKILDDLMKPDGLPLAVVRHHFKHLAALTQVALNQLNANFSIEIDPDEELSFRFTRLDEAGAQPLPMSKLSGGQRIRLCIAFLIAVQQRLVKEVGLLVLDEPSTHTDIAGVEALADFITDLGPQLQNSEMQIWLADHSIELRRSMQKILELV